MFFANIIKNLVFNTEPLAFTVCTKTNKPKRPFFKTPSFDFLIHNRMHGRFEENARFFNLDLKYMQIKYWATRWHSG